LVSNSENVEQYINQKASKKVKIRLDQKTKDLREINEKYLEVDHLMSLINKQDIFENLHSQFKHQIIRDIREVDPLLLSGLTSIKETFLVEQIENELYSLDDDTFQLKKKNILQTTRIDEDEAINSFSSGKQIEINKGRVKTAEQNQLEPVYISTPTIKLKKNKKYYELTRERLEGLITVYEYNYFMFRNFKDPTIEKIHNLLGINNIKEVCSKFKHLNTETLLLCKNNGLKNKPAQR